MRVFIINDRVVIDIINNLTLDDKIKEIVKSIILKYDYSFINYIYSVFSVYTTYYFSIADENSSLNLNDAREIHSKFTKHNINADIGNIFMADIYDIMFSTSDFDKSKYRHFFYEDMCNRLINLLGDEETSVVMEDIFESLEFIFGSVEETIIFGMIQSEELTNNVFVYTEINNNCLMIYIL